MVEYEKLANTAISDPKVRHSMTMAAYPYLELAVTSIIYIRP